MRSFDRYIVYLGHGVKGGVTWTDHRPDCDGRCNVPAEQRFPDLKLTDSAIMASVDAENDLKLKAFFYEAS
jgi:hypothetical protein